MRTITVGRTGLEVSRIAFGTWQLGGEWGSFDEEAAIAAIRRARDLGITLFDTAQAYGFGASEQLLGRALRPELSRDRESVVIATKGGIRPPERDASAAFLRRGVEESLRYLGVDEIDIYQVHWPDPDVPQEETAGALQEMVEEGKIRHVGVSNYDVAQMEAFAAVRPVEVLQPPYHLLQREIEEEILPYTRAHDIGVLAYSPRRAGCSRGGSTRARPSPPTTGAARRARSPERGCGATSALCGGWRSWPATSASPSASSRSRGCSPSPACTSRSWARAGPPTSRRARPPPTWSSMRTPSRESRRSRPRPSR